MIVLERSMWFFDGLGLGNPTILCKLYGFAANFPVLGQVPQSDEVQWFLILNRGEMILVQSCQGMYKRMGVHVLIVEFLLATHCILTQ